MLAIIESLNRHIKASNFSGGLLAENLGVHRVTLNRYLNGHTDMPAQMLLDILRILNIDLSDLMEDEEAPRVLFRSDNPEVHTRSFYHRAISRLTFYASAVKQLGIVYPEVRLPQRLHLDNVDPKQVDSREIETAALETRQVLHLPERGPLLNLFSQISRAVKVIEFNGDRSSRCEGFTLSSKKFGLGVVINAGIHIERRCASVAHELAHVVLHPESFATADQAPKASRALDNREKMAWAFAGQFLLPSSDLHDLFSSYVGRKGSHIPFWFVIRLKHEYGVSASLVLTRLLNDGYISSGRQYGYLKKKFYPGGSKEELYPLDQANHTLGSLQGHFETVVARMYFDDKISEDRVTELLDKDSDQVSDWLKIVAGQYSFGTGDIGVAS